MPDDKLVPYIQICTLAAAREADVGAYDGVITIENSTIEDTAEGPFRIETFRPPQRVLVFDDIISPMDDYLLSEEWHVRSALRFAGQWAQPSLLIHCHAGMSRSPAIALAVLADRLGAGREEEAVQELMKVAPLCTPNMLVVQLSDRVLEREGRLIDAVGSL